MSSAIYVLKLMSNKYYVGKTNDFKKRFQQHLKGLGPEWTKIHKPLKITEIITNSSNIFEEDNKVKKYMMDFGINNVRGGSYSNLNLTECQIKMLNLEMATAKHSCFNCDKYGHLYKECISKRKF
jgi:predicted GIY-YIG superfamily endonuclease